MSKLSDEVAALLHDQVMWTGDENNIEDTIYAVITLVLEKNSKAERLRKEIARQDVEIIRLQSEVDAFYLSTDNKRLLAMTHDRDGLRAQLADCQAVIKKLGHGPDCTRHKYCSTCDKPHWSNCHTYDHDHLFVASPCTCGHDRTTEETT